MDGLSNSDVARLLDFAYQIGSATTLTEFASTISTSIGGLIGNDLASYTEVRHDPPHALAVCYPDVPDPLRAELARLAHQHPLITRPITEGGARTISDYLSRREFHALELYTDVYRALGAEDQIAINLHAPADRTIGVALNRDRASFGARDRAVLDLLRPMLIKSYRRVCARERLCELSAGVDCPDAGAATIIVESDGTVEYATPHARAWLHADMTSKNDGRVPQSVLAWLKDGASPSMTITRAESRLRITRSELDSADCVLLELYRQPHPPGKGLTPRERDILGYVAEGNTNLEIANRLAISQRTVEHHLENAYRKLGVHNRTGALKALADPLAGTR